MKNALILVLVSLASISAHAAPKSSRILQMSLDRRDFGTTPFNGGSLTVDTATREATLTLYRSTPCTPGRVCPMIVFAPKIITLPLVSRQTNNCNAVVYTAVSDRSMVDGLRQVLTITDNANNECKTMRALSPIEASYETMGRTQLGSVQTYSSFSADAFVSAEN